MIHEISQRLAILRHSDLCTSVSLKIRVPLSFYGPVCYKYHLRPSAIYSPSLTFNYVLPLCLQPCCYSSGSWHLGGGCGAIHSMMTYPFCSILVLFSLFCRLKIFSINALIHLFCLHL